jgi:hypothetical protein
MNTNNVKENVCHHRTISVTKPYNSDRHCRKRQHEFYDVGEFLIAERVQMHLNDQKKLY